MDKLRCPKCGSRIKEDRTCPLCGYHVPTGPNDTEAHLANERSRRVLGVVAAIAMLIMSPVLYGVGYYIGGNVVLYVVATLEFVLGVVILVYFRKLRL